jgi:hypothetical protein
MDPHNYMIQVFTIWGVVCRDNVKFNNVLLAVVALTCIICIRNHFLILCILKCKKKKEL